MMIRHVLFWRRNMGYDVSGLEPSPGRRVSWPDSADIPAQGAQAQPPHGTAGGRTPVHYRGKNALQPFDVIDAFGLDFYSGNLIKYVLRYKLSSRRQDLEKARHYLDEFIKRESADSP